MARTPLNVYRGLTSIHLSKDISRRITTAASKFSDFHFAGQPMTVHLSRFIALMSRLIAYLEGRSAIVAGDLPAAIDVLDYFMSTSKWWLMTREQPGFVIRPATRDSRDFLQSLAQTRIGGGTLGRINTATERLDSFLNEHAVGSDDTRSILRDSMVSAWVLLSASSCKNQGQTITTESDFEIAYDTVRVLLFYTPAIDFRALGAVRRIARSPNLIRIASVNLAAGFERQLDSSPAAIIEIEQAPTIRGRCASIYRSILTNSLRFLVQVQASLLGADRIEAANYATIIPQSLLLLEKIGIPSTIFQDEQRIKTMFKHLPSDTNFIERLELVVQRIESLIADIHRRDFLLTYSRLVPRMASLLLFIATATSNSENTICDEDVKRGLVLLDRLLS